MNIIPIGAKVRARDTRRVATDYHGRAGTVVKHHAVVGDNGEVVVRMAVDLDGYGRHVIFDFADLVREDGPTIDFSTDARGTARQYADNIIAGKWVRDFPALRAVLEQVVLGSETVDALLLAEALDQAQRANLTRYGQSMTRREAGKQVAHLQYIVRGVLSSAIKMLPPIEEGQRSPALAKAKSELSDAKADFDRVNKARLAAEKRNLALQDDCNRLVTRERKRAEAILGEARKHKAMVHEVERQRDVLSVTLIKAFELLAPEAQQRLHGYWDGVEDVMPS